MSRYDLQGNEKILIIPPNGIGDNIMMMPLAYNLKSQYPNLEIHFLSNRSNKASKIASLSRAVDRVYEYDFGKYDIVNYLSFFMKQFFSLIKQLKNEQYDHVLSIDLNPLRFMIVRSLAHLKAVISSKRTGFENQTETGIRLLDHFGIKVQRDWTDLIPVNEESVEEIAKKFKIVRPYVCLNGYGKSRLRTYDQMMDIAVSLRKQGIDVVLVGIDPSHIEMNNVRDLVNKTTLEEVISVIAGARLFVSVDGGLMHIGFAMNIPTIGLFGNVSSICRIPVNDKSSLIAAYDEEDINMIEPKEVIAEMLKVL
jgi:ADP-heptose:LPS heptosyltransferase